MQTWLIDAWIIYDGCMSCLPRINTDKYSNDSTSSSRQVATTAPVIIKEIIISCFPENSNGKQ